MKLFDKSLGSDVVFIAEIGVNHEGSLDKAEELLRLAAGAGADAVKFQSYTPEHYVSRIDSERFERVTRFGLDEAAHDHLKSVARDCGVNFFSTAVSDDWIPYLAANCDVIKIASGDLNFEPVIRAAAATERTVIMSVGLGDLEEIDRAVGWFKSAAGTDDVADRLILMHCIAAYPTPVDQANVANIPFLRERYGLVTGFSNHIIGPDACFAAIALGAPVIEVHFTDQKKGRTFRDHALSFEPDDLQSLIKTGRKIRQSIGRPGTFRQDAESGNLAPMRKGIVALRDLAAGHTLGADDLGFARPAAGYPCTETGAVIGRTLAADIPAGYPIMPEHLT
ncbi:MAG: N-acetylneuraminate synthase family protein [Rhodospirillales bacterium]